MGVPAPRTKAPTGFLDLPRGIRQQILYETHTNRKPSKVGPPFQLREPSYYCSQLELINDYHRLKGPVFHETMRVLKLIKMLGEVHDTFKEDIQFVGKIWGRELSEKLEQRKQKLFGDVFWKQMANNWKKQLKYDQRNGRAAEALVQARKHIELLMD